MGAPTRFPFPEGRSFAFTIVDDTDVATVQNVRPVYQLLRDLGLKTTKTVWPLAYEGSDSKFAQSETLDDPDYLKFVHELQDWGFELTWHSPTMESSSRSRIVEGLRRFHELIGHPPRVHACHAENRENLYWGTERVDSRIVRWLLRRGGRPAPGYFVGHVPESEYWWGDLCQEHIRYGRNLTFDSINLASVNPSTPYRDPRRPLVQRWFSSSDAEDASAFVSLLRSSNQTRLEREGGFCIVATHLGKGFTRNGEVLPDVRRVMEELAARNGWFPTASELLDWLQAQRETDELPASEWRTMQFRFAADAVLRRARRRLASHYARRKMSGATPAANH